MSGVKGMSGVICNVRGEVFPSIRATAKHFGVGTSTVSRALDHGRMDNLGLGKTCNRKRVAFNGVWYPSQAALSRAANISQQDISRAIKIAKDCRETFAKTQWGTLTW